MNKIMIYVREKFFLRQIEFLRFFLNEGSFDVISWMYPESKFTHLAGLKFESGSKISGAAVTNYEDGRLPNCTIRQSFTGSFVDLVKANRRAFERNVDSIVLYKPAEFEWSACAIGHEGICIVSDDAYYKKLVNAGFNALDERPDYW